jgi:hypothetical protein
MVFFPFELDVGPDILRLPGSGLATFTQTIVHVEFQHAGIGDNQSERFMSVIEAEFVSQSSIQSTMVIQKSSAVW